MDMDDMAILRPHITKIGNRRYRNLAFRGSHFDDKSDCADFDIYRGNEYEEDEPDCAMVEESASGFKTSIEVAGELVKFICGRQMETKIRIENETNTQIELPRRGIEAPIVITGARKRDVLSCRRKIELIMESSRQKIPPTHFLSFPLYNENIIQRMEEFKTTALKSCKQSKDLDASIFTKPQKLHLTIVMLTLLTEKEVEFASSMLNECYEEVIKPRVDGGPIKITLQGVECMNDDPSKVHVLYAKVHEVDGSGRLQELADAVMKYFIMKGLGKEERDRVKLHATVITTKLREHNQAEATPPVKNNRRHGFSSRTSFDAREIIEIFKDFEFGEHAVDSIYLAQRGVFDANGHYHCCKSLSLS